MGSTDASGGIFTTISDIFNAILLFGVPLYRILVRQMDISGLISPRSQVLNKVCINKASGQDWFVHSRGARVREVSRFSKIQVAPVTLNCLKILIIGNFCIDLDVRGGVLL